MSQIVLLNFANSSHKYHLPSHLIIIRCVGFIVFQFPLSPYLIVLFIVMLCDSDGSNDAE
uniref:Uncharacterized protein n=1 Tax=Schistosoma japonicum TaxID=6182 RepID=Q5C152_SCHJA|nr:unknown [Schistosoma japonicum]